MEITYMSDLHLEFGPMEADPEGEVLVLAGDIVVKARQDLLDWINGLRFDHIVYVLGNHEFYRGSVDRIYEKTRARLADHVHVLENETVEVGDVAFHGCTLWTDFDGQRDESMWMAEVGMNDYRLIRKTGGAERWRPQDALASHIKSRTWLETTVLPGDVVVTHMAPSFRSIAPHFYMSRLNGAYASALDEMVERLRPSLWFHGHIHWPQDYTIGETRVLANPRGYVGHEDHIGFDPSRTVTV